MGFCTRWLDGRIDDPKAGWKERGLRTVGTRPPFHMVHVEGGRGHPQGDPVPAAAGSAGEAAQSAKGASICSPPSPLRNDCSPRTDRPPPDAPEQAILLGPRSRRRFAARRAEVRVAAPARGVGGVRLPRLLAAALRARRDRSRRAGLSASPHGDLARAKRSEARLPVLVARAFTPSWRGSTVARGSRAPGISSPRRVRTHAPTHPLTHAPTHPRTRRFYWAPGTGACPRRQNPALMIGSRRRPLGLLRT